jgi:RimJ/RimL family protein N-acetyltransferase
MAVLALTAHYYIATSAPEEWIRRQLPPGDLLAPMSPRFLSALADELQMRDDGIDVLLAAPGLPGDATLQQIAASERPRVMRANAHREDVQVFTDPTATVITVILGHGLALRREIAIEVEPGSRGQGLATQTLTKARRLVDTDDVLFAQTAPGNAASLRAFLTAGFRPIGSEILFFPR